MINKVHHQESESDSIFNFAQADEAENNSIKCTIIGFNEFIWDEENCDKLLHLVSTRGNNWKLFEKHFPG